METVGYPFAALPVREKSPDVFSVVRTTRDFELPGIIYVTFRDTYSVRGGTMKVVVTSDQHLGYANSDKAAFNAFLDNLSQRSDVTHFVLLGDVVDMWRRDASGVFLEHHDTVTKLLALKSKGVQIFYVAGNHDYHVRGSYQPSIPLQVPQGVDFD